MPSTLMVHLQVLHRSRSSCVTIHSPLIASVSPLTREKPGRCGKRTRLLVPTWR
jgi:hypothetical protein